MRPALVAALFLLPALLALSCGSARNSAARLYMQQEDWDSAETLLRKEVEEFPAHAEAWLLLGRVSRAQGHYADALSELNQAALLDPSLAKEADAEIAAIPAENEPPAEEDFRTEFRKALEAEHYLRADGIRTDWLDYLGGSAESELTLRGRRDLESLRSAGGITDSLLIPLRKSLLSALKAGDRGRASEIQGKINERLRSAYPTSDVSKQPSLLLLRELSETERLDLSIVDLFLAR